MSYLRAWLLVEQINEALREPAISTAYGGQHGGSVTLTPTGERVIELYHTIQEVTRASARQEFRAIGKLVEVHTYGGGQSALLLQAYATTGIAPRRVLLWVKKCHKRSWHGVISFRSIIASKKPKVAPYGNPDLMQASRGGAIGIVSVAQEVLKVQDDSPQVIEINGEGVQSFGRAALVKDRVANLRRQAANVLRVVTIFRMIAASS